MDKSPDAFRTISEAADDLDLPQHVLRFWETRFPQIKPLKRGGGRRYYRPDDVELLRTIKQLLYGEGYTIKGVQKLFKEQGARAVVTAQSGETPGHAAFAGGVETTVSQQTDFIAHATEGDALETRGEKPEPTLARAALSLADLQALRAALADISEGERILALAHAG
jgi:DNA-binding transcriptional MerR regulator